MIGFLIYLTIGAFIATGILWIVSQIRPEYYEKLCENRIRGVLVMYGWTLFWPIVLIMAFVPSGDE